MNQTKYMNETSVASHTCTFCSMLNEVQNAQVSDTTKMSKVLKLVTKNTYNL